MSSFAFVVGVNQYVDDRDGLKPLGGAIRDSQDFIDWLTDGAGGNVPTENIFHSFSPDTVSPTKVEATDKLKDMLKQFENGQLNERLYFYFAGHGAGNPDEVDSNLLCLSDWTRRWSYNAFPCVPAISFFKFLGVFKELVFIFDCCRTRYERARLTDFIEHNFSLGTYKKAAVFIAFSTAYDDEAFEYDYITPDSSIEKRGVFTKVLIEGLRGAAANQEGIVDDRALGTYLMSEVDKQAQKLGFLQKPEYTVTLGDNKHSIEFSRIKLETQTITVKLTGPDAYDVINERNTVVEKITARNGETSYVLNLNKGFYSIIRQSDESEKTFRIPYKSKTSISFL